jgi:adenylate cyclase, class 2
MPGPRRNLELKAADPDPPRSLRVCADLGAEDHGVLEQTDTYFEVPTGRLKLRRRPGAATELIAYQRPDTAGQKESRYELVEIDDADGLERALTMALGVVAVVRKSRRLFLLDGVRIHLDAVEDLGTFIEFEAVAGPDDTDLTRFESRLNSLRGAFAITDDALIPQSYCDLLLAAPRRRA